MPRKKKVEEPVEEVIAEVPEENKEAVEMMWVETVDSTGRHMIQVPKVG